VRKRRGEEQKKKEPKKVREILLELCENKYPFYLSIIRKDEKGAELFSDQVYVYLESAEFEEKEGEIGTLYYKLKLKEYVKLVQKNYGVFVKIERAK